MNPDQEMQAEAMDEAQDEILRLTEALGAEKEAHMETAKALVACREALKEIVNEARLAIERDECEIECEDVIDMGKDALSHTAGDGYVSKASVKPIVEALKKAENAIQRVAGINDENRLGWALRDVDAALEQAKLLGLV